ncbi:MAG TPA: PAS domain S-box protein, partial [Alphaproteobacteria bacterium]|nr:PAS domain S-box protein [Alphaproteobacteria bacterium]
LGADRFILKPQEPKALITILREVLEESYTVKQVTEKSPDKDMEFLRQHNEVLFKKLEKKMSDLESTVRELRKSEERYRLSFENVTDVICFVDNDLIFSDISPSVEKSIGLKPEHLIGRPVTDLEKLLTPESFERIMSNLQQILDGEAIPSDTYQFLTEDGASIYGEISGAPLIRDEKIIGLIGIARNITERKKVEEKLKESFEQIRRALYATVNAMAATIEARDPYTAGHQRRVSDLARSIATEMNLTPDQIEGIRTAGILHDIGKISIPSEILNKSHILTELEYALIKEHPLSGYNILKGIDFPWPIARMVLEHHERVNGSGYPNGLTGDKLLTESKILAVADVIEAMASYRPYRSGGGIDIALNEIQNNRDILYDSKVTDACLRLFNEKGYTLQGEK